MASEIKTNKISPATGTALTIGDSGDTLSIDADISGNLTTTGDLTVDTNTLYVDSTNNKVGVGTSSPSDFLEVNSGTGSFGGLTLTSSASANEGSEIIFTATGATTGAFAKIGVQRGGNNASANDGLKFYTSSAWSTIAPTERMRIDSSGNLLVGQTAKTNASDGISLTATGNSYFTATNTYVALFNRLGTDGQIFFFQNDSSNVGSISVSGASTAYNTSSDYRLKENVQPLTNGIDRLKQLKPSHWTWTQDGKYGEGFIAHEAQQVVPLSVTGTKDAMRLEEYEVTPAVFNDEDVETTAAVMGTREVPDHQGIDQSKLVPLLTSALQEAIAKIESLETRVSALEAN